MSGFVSQWLGDNEETLPPGFKPNIHYLTIAFLFLYFLAATQDISVDGWALTMLSK